MANATWLIIFAVLAIPAGASEQETGMDHEARKHLTEEALAILKDKDSLAATAFLLKQPDPLLTLNVFGDAANHLYWTDHNLPMSLALARSGMDYGLLKAMEVHSASPEQAEALKSEVKAICYNIASFAWPGWGEPGIVCTPSDIALGRDAAKINLRLAQELTKDDLPMSRAWWMIGAYELADGDYTKAQKTFRQAAELAKKAKAADETLLNEGYVCIASILASKDRQAPTAEYESVKAKLAELKDGEFFAGQLDMAMKVFGEKE